MAHPQPDPQSQYADYTYMSVQDHFLSASTTIVTLAQGMSDLIPNAGPLSQVLSITAQLFAIIDEIKTNKDSCEFLVERILRFLKEIAEECKNKPIQADSPTGKRLKNLVS